MATLGARRGMMAAKLFVFGLLFLVRQLNLF
jgi:hypothetical protein